MFKKRLITEYIECTKCKKSSVDKSVFQWRFSNNVKLTVLEILYVKLLKPTVF